MKSGGGGKGTFFYSPYWLTTLKIIVATQGCSKPFENTCEGPIARLIYYV